jgi:hypothetical protein
MTKPAPLGFTMKRLTCSAAVTAALFAASGASAATVPLSGVENLTGVESKIELHRVEDVRLSFSSTSNADFRGVVTWSTSRDRSSITFTENFLDDGTWRVSNNSAQNRRGADESGDLVHGAARVGPVNDPTANEIFIDFDGRGDTVFVWLNTKSGNGTVNYTATRASAEAAPLTPVPLPAGAWLLITAIGAIAMLRRRKTG